MPRGSCLIGCLQRAVIATFSGVPQLVIADQRILASLHATEANAWIKL